MKKCCVCKIEKDLSLFHKRKSGQSYSYCIDCHREYLKNHYAKNKKYYKDKAKVYDKKTVSICNEYIKNLTCFDCGFSFKDYPTVCDFHHHKKNKEYNVANLKKASFLKFMNEVLKCVPLCSNCHRIRHYLITNKMEHTHKRSNRFGKTMRD